MTDDPLLALPFALLAVAAGYGALEMSRQAVGSQRRGRGRLWLLGSAVAMTVSTWCTHFIGLAVLASGERRITGGGVGAVVVLLVLVVLLATTLARRRNGRAAAPLVGGALLGSALSGMHGTGLAGVMLVDSIGRDSRVGVVSMGVAAALAVLVPFLVLRLRSDASARQAALAAAAAAERAREATETRFQQIAEYSGEVFYVAEADGVRLRYVSPAFERVWGVPAAGVTVSPRALLERVHADDRARVQASLARMAAGESTDESYRIVSPDGSPRWVRDRSYPAPARGDEPACVVGIAEDVTAQREAEERLARLNTQLEERVVARTDELAAANRALEEQNRRAQEASRLKSEFLANMSHELRTPLNAIIGFAELMHDGKVGPVSELQQEYLGDVLTSARHLLQLINDVLDLSKVEAGKMEFRPEPVELGRVIGEVRDILRTVAAQKRIRVAVEVAPMPGPVIADPSRLKQVLYNYLSNALKFTPDEGAVTLRAVPVGTEAFRVEVHDTGIGIAADDLGRLFGEFQQLDAGASKRFGGTGLGLALTRRIVEAQGGEVGVSSTVGEGSTFHAVLPRAPLAGYVAPAAHAVEADRFAAPSPSSGRAAADRRVLIVEDEPGDRDWLVGTLAAAGYATHVATTGQAAVAACQAERFDAVVLDLLLPDMSGWDVLRAIRADARNRNVPVLVSTVVAERASGIGFAIHDYLVKPVQAPDLLASLERAGVSPERVEPVLVVDDDQMALKLMYAMLSQLGYQPVCADSGEQGLAVVEELRPAAVVLDLLMPGVDGFEFLDRFRRLEVGRLTPVIVWTNKDLTQDDLVRLHERATSLVTKADGGSAHVLHELERHLTSRRATPSAGVAALGGVAARGSDGA